MDINEFKQTFKVECKKNNIKFDEQKSEKLYEYMKLILEWNEKINLTAIKDEKMFIVKHFIDSLTVNNFLDNAQNLLDIGTGAGFPGIPLKIYNPDINITLIDAVNKKIMVLNDIINKLELQNIEALHIRAEDLAKDLNYRESFDVVTTRAVSNFSTISEYMLPFVKIDGKAICMKGPNVEEELEYAKNPIKILGGTIEKVEKFNINNEFERNLVVIKKVKQTDKKYPRGQGKPSKEPLK